MRFGDLKDAFECRVEAFQFSSTNDEALFCLWELRGAVELLIENLEEQIKRCGKGSEIDLEQGVEKK